MKRVAIVGAGAIGGFFGVKLAHAGARVSVLARGATLAALNSDGWTLESGGQRIVAPVHAAADAAELGVQDVVFLTLKAYSLAEVVPRIGALFGPDTLLVPAINGVPWWFTDARAGLPVQGRLKSADADGTIESSLPADPLGCVVYASCTALAPGVIRHSSGDRVVLGEAAQQPGTAVTPRVAALVDLLRNASLQAEATSDIRTETWKKLLGNAAFNPVSFVTGSPTDLLIDDPLIHALFSSMMSETLAVGRAMGIDAAIEPAARIAITRRLGHIKTSMLQDAEAGRPIELDAILGAVIELGQRLEVPTPACATVYAMARMRAATFGLIS